MRPLNAAEVEDKNCTEIVHVLDENVSGHISLHSIFYGYSSPFGTTALYNNDDYTTGTPLQLVAR